MRELGASGAVAFGAGAVVLRRRRCAARPPHRLRQGLRRRGRAFRPASPPGRGGGRLRSSSLLSPTGSGSLFRAYPARVRARVGAGAVRTPDCAHETPGALLPSAESVVFKNGAARPRGTRGGGSGVRFPRDHHTTIRHMSSPYREQNLKILETVHVRMEFPRASTTPPLTGSAAVRRTERVLPSRKVRPAAQRGERPIFMDKQDRF